MSKYIELNIPHPYAQAATVVVSAGLIMLIGSFVAKNPLFPWLTSGAFLLLFTVFNNGAAIFADSFGKYAQQSLTSFVGTLLAMLGLAYLISGISISEAQPYRTIYLVMVIANFTLLALCFLIRQAVDFLMSKDEKRARKFEEMERREREKGK